MDYSQPETASTVASSQALTAGRYGPGTGPGFGSNDLWLEILRDTNTALVDVTLHGATNGVWQLTTKTNLTDTNAWSIIEIQVDDGTTNDLYFGPYPLDASARFFRAQLGTNLFSVVATNLPNPVGIAYSPATSSLIMPIGWSNNETNFGILNSNGVFAAWSTLSRVEEGFEVRIATVKSTTNSLGLVVGDLLFGAADPPLTPAIIGWLSADATQSNTNWLVITNEPRVIEAITIDETGLWGNDLLAVGGDDALIPGGENLHVWRVHSRTNIQLVTDIFAQHLEGALTVPGSPKYGPWAGKFLTAAEFERTIFAVDTNGAVTSFPDNIGGDSLTIIPTNQDLYCVQFHEGDGHILRLPREFLRRYIGDILIGQSGEILSQDPAIFIVRWDPLLNQFDTVQSVDLFTYFPNDGFFEKMCFAPIRLPPL